jgi:hypothetical protein
MARNYYQIVDFYPHLKNPKKYVGSRPLSMRSGWEIQYAQHLDKHPSVLEWSSESIIIMYISPVDGMPHRYFTDFWQKCRDKDGSVKEYLIEIKPYTQTLAESIKKPARVTKGYIEKVQTFMKNQAKWDAARTWCAAERKKGRNIEFVIITEKDGFFKT